MFKTQYKKIIFLLLTAVFLFFGGNVLAEVFGDGTGGYYLTSSSLTWPEQITGTKYYLPDKAEIQSISVYLYTQANQQKFRAGIYNWAGNLVGETDELLVAGAGLMDRWHVLNFSEKPILEQGDYWLVIAGYNAFAPNYNSEVYRVSNTTGGTYQSLKDYGPLPSSFSGATLFDVLELSIFATYDVLPDNSIIQIYGSDITTLTGTIGTLMSDVSVVVWLAIGLPLGFVVIKKTIALITKR